jgi:hypothetical protein
VEGDQIGRIFICIVNKIAPTFWATFFIQKVAEIAHEQAPIKRVINMRWATLWAIFFKKHF